MDERARGAPGALPGIWGHTLLLWRLRLWLAGADRRGGARLLSVLGYLGSASPALPLGLAGYALLSWAPVAGSILWSRFFFDLLTFVATTVWVAWPVLAADVDDHAEVSRFSTLPIAPLRLLFASTAASLLEPLALVVSAPVIGATAALLQRGGLPPSLPLVAAAFACWALLAIAWSRAALHLALGVLRRRRGAQAVGGFFLLFLLVSLFIPPVDVSWLEGATTGGLGGLSAAFLVQAAVGLSRVPTGFYGEAVRLIVEGRLLGALLEMGGLLFFAWGGLFLAWRALMRFHREPEVSPMGRPSLADRFLAGGRGKVGLLVRRELLDLYRNPRARLLAFVPLILAVAMRLLSLRPLLLHWRGESADAWIVAGLTAYGVVVFALTFAQNLFGYDGEGLAALLAAPLRPGEILRAKVRAILLAVGGVALFQCTFFALYLTRAHLIPWLMGLASAAALVPAFLLVGVFVSVRFATRYHANLERRDQQPRAAILTGMLAAGLGAAPLLVVLSIRGRQAPGFLDVAVLALAALACAALFLALRPLAERAFVRRREAVLQALRRE